MASESASIRVVVRLRPHFSGPSWDVNYAVSEGKNIEVRIARRPELFTLDHALDPSVGQEEAFKIIAKPTIDEVLKGYNGTIFAYGQSGSGKTYTVFGPEGGTKIMEDMGLIPRTAAIIFASLDSKKNKVAGVKMSIFEIYMEKLRDLLVPLSNRNPPKLRVAMGKTTRIVGLEEKPVQSVKAVQRLIKQASKRRRTDSQNLNATSSRSHCVTTFIVEQECKDGTKLKGMLNIADLAGSENAAKAGTSGKRLKEGASINKSLTALSKVIKSLSGGSVEYHDVIIKGVLNSELLPEKSLDAFKYKCLARWTPRKIVVSDQGIRVYLKKPISSTDLLKMGKGTLQKCALTELRVEQDEVDNIQIIGGTKKRKFISYRDSVLTAVLKDSLGGNTKTTLLCNIAPEEAHISESVATLKFARRAKTIKTVVKKNLNIPADILQAQMQKKMKEMEKSMLSEGGSSSTLVKKLRDRLNELENENGVLTNKEQTASNALVEQKREQIRLKNEMTDYKEEIALLKKSVSELEGIIAERDETIVSRDNRIAALNKWKAVSNTCKGTFSKPNLFAEISSQLTLSRMGTDNSDHSDLAHAAEKMCNMESQIRKMENLNVAEQNLQKQEHDEIQNINIAMKETLEKVKAQLSDTEKQNEELKRQLLELKEKLLEATDLEEELEGFDEESNVEIDAAAAYLDIFVDQISAEPKATARAPNLSSLAEGEISFSGRQTTSVSLGSSPMKKASFLRSTTLPSVLKNDKIDTDSELSAVIDLQTYDDFDVGYSRSSKSFSADDGDIVFLGAGKGDCNAADLSKLQKKNRMLELRLMHQEDRFSEEAALKEQAEERIKQIETEIKSFQSESKVSRLEVTSAKKEISRLKSNLKELKDGNDELEKSVAALEDEKEKLLADSRQREATRRVDKMKTKRLRVQHKEMMTRLKLVMDKLKEREEKVQVQRGKMHMMQDQIDKLGKKVEDKDMEISRLTVEGAEKEKEFKMQSFRSTALSEKQGTEKRIYFLRLHVQRRRAKKLEIQNVKLQCQVETLSSSKKKSSNLLKDSIATLEKLRKERKELESKNTELVNDINQADEHLMKIVEDNQKLMIKAQQFDQMKLAMGVPVDGTTKKCSAIPDNHPSDETKLENVECQEAAMGSNNTAPKSDASLTSRLSQEKAEPFQGPGEPFNLSIKKITGTIISIQCTNKWNVQAIVDEIAKTEMCSSESVILIYRGKRMAASRSLSTFPDIGKSDSIIRLILKYRPDVGTESGGIHAKTETPSAPPLPGVHSPQMPLFNPEGYYGISAPLSQPLLDSIENEIDIEQLQNNIKKRGEKAEVTTKAVGVIKLLEMLEDAQKEVKNLMKKLRSLEEELKLQEIKRKEDFEKYESEYRTKEKHISELKIEINAKKKVIEEVKSQAERQQERLKEEHLRTLDIALTKANNQRRAICQEINQSLEESNKRNEREKQDLEAAFNRSKQDLEAAFNRSLKNMKKEFQEVQIKTLRSERADMARARDKMARESEKIRQERIDEREKIRKERKEEREKIGQERKELKQLKVKTENIKKGLLEKIRCLEKPSDLGEIIWTRGEKQVLSYLEKSIGAKSAFRTAAIVFVEPDADMKVTCTYDPETSHEYKLQRS